MGRRRPLCTEPEVHPAFTTRDIDLTNRLHKKLQLKKQPLPLQQSSSYKTCKDSPLNKCKKTEKQEQKTRLQRTKTKCRAYFFDVPTHERAPIRKVSAVF